MTPTSGAPPSAERRRASHTTPISHRMTIKLSGTPKSHSSSASIVTISTHGELTEVIPTLRDQRRAPPPTGASRRMC